MQKKVGIRLRHLQIHNEIQRQQNIDTVEYPNTQIIRKRDRSPSPMNRRKIFPQTNNQPKQVPNLQSKRYSNQQRTQISIPFSQNSQKISHRNSDIASNSNRNHEYQSQVQRLIQSLKKKSIELQRKQQIISKLRNEVQLLRAENSSYLQQIKTLKAQIQFQKNSVQNKGPIINNYDIGRMAKTSNDFQYNKNPPAIKNILTNQFIEEIGATPPERSRVSYHNLSNTMSSNNSRVSYNKNTNNREPEQYRQRRVETQHLDKEQDSVLSDYLSPLMVFTADQPKKGQKASSNMSKKNNQPQKFSKNYLNRNDNIPSNDNQKYFQKPTNYFIQQQSQNRSKKNGFEVKKNSYQVPYQSTQSFKPQSYIQPQPQQPSRPQMQPQAHQITSPAPPQKYERKFSPIQNNNGTEYNFLSSLADQNSFSKKNNTKYKQNEKVNIPKFGYQSNAGYQQVRKYPNPAMIEQKKGWPTLQSSSGNFPQIPKPNFNQYIKINSPSSLNNGKNPEPPRKKELQIEDSRQFKFQDFDFSQLDSQNGNSNF